MNIDNLQMCRKTIYVHKTLESNLKELALFEGRKESEIIREICGPAVQQRLREHYILNKAREQWNAKSAPDLQAGQHGESIRESKAG